MLTNTYNLCLQIHIYKYIYIYIYTNIIHEYNFKLNTNNVFVDFFIPPHYARGDTIKILCNANHLQ